MCPQPFQIQRLDIVVVQTDLNKFVKRKTEWWKLQIYEWPCSFILYKYKNVGKRKRNDHWKADVPVITNLTND